MAFGSFGISNSAALGGLNDLSRKMPQAVSQAPAQVGNPAPPSPPGILGGGMSAGMGTLDPTGGGMSAGMGTLDPTGGGGVGFGMGTLDQQPISLAPEAPMGPPPPSMGLPGALDPAPASAGIAPAVGAQPAPGPTPMTPAPTALTPPPPPGMQSPGMLQGAPQGWGQGGRFGGGGLAGLQKRTAPAGGLRRFFQGRGF